jgi:hypothetical protein
MPTATVRSARYFGVSGCRSSPSNTRQSRSGRVPNGLDPHVREVTYGGRRPSAKVGAPGRATHRDGRGRPLRRARTTDHDGVSGDRFYDQVDVPDGGDAGRRVIGAKKVVPARAQLLRFPVAVAFGAVDPVGELAVGLVNAVPRGIDGVLIGAGRSAHDERDRPDRASQWVRDFWTCLASTAHGRVGSLPLAQDACVTHRGARCRRIRP